MAISISKVSDNPWDLAQYSVQRNFDLITTTVNQALATQATMSAFRLGAQSIPNATFTAIQFDTNEGPDQFQMHLAGKSAFTMPSSGLYTAWFSGVFAANATGYRRGKITTNGADLPGACYTHDAANVGVSISCALTLTLIAGDRVEFWVSQSSGGALDFGGAGLLTARASFLRVG